MYIFCVFLSLLPIILANILDYEGFKVYSVNFSTPEQLQTLSNYTEYIDFWSIPRRNSSSPVKMMVNPTLQPHITKIFHEKNIAYRVVIPNVVQYLHEESLERFRQEVRTKRQSKTEKRSISFDRYLRHSEMNQYLRDLEQKYPSFVSVVTVGYSYEGREILAIKISRSNANKTPIIFIDAGIHAREWIAPATALYIINQLVENPKKKYMSKNIDWYIIPLLNPDGYEFSHTTDRFWRKTRSNGKKCKGVDGNRNFSYLWGVAGASSGECSKIYKGPYPFSEVELQALKSFTKPLISRIKLYLAFHSYGNYVLYPYGHESVIPDNLKQLNAVGNIFAYTLQQRSGDPWTVGNSATTLYPATGTADNWMMGVNGVPLAYCIELQEHNFSASGFEYPEWELLSAVRDTFEGIQALQWYIETSYGP